MLVSSCFFFFRAHAFERGAPKRAKAAWPENVRYDENMFLAEKKGQKRKYVSSVSFSFFSAQAIEANPEKIKIA